MPITTSLPYYTTIRDSRDNVLIDNDIDHLSQLQSTGQFSITNQGMYESINIYIVGWRTTSKDLNKDLAELQSWWFH